MMTFRRHSQRFPLQPSVRGLEQRRLEQRRSAVGFRPEARAVSIGRVGIAYAQLALLSAASLASCASSDPLDLPNESASTESLGPLARSEQAIRRGPGKGHDAPTLSPQEFRRASGETLFDNALPGSNGRSCATCHVRDDHTALKPEHVVAELARNPKSPLFNRLDADDPNADVPTYEHLKKGLVRVRIPLPDNMDLIDYDGNITTPADRVVEVWRGVPTVENTVFSGPYQYDGRLETLEEQAQSAVTAHSEGGTVPRRQLERIAEFQESQFSSDRARIVGKQVARGVPLSRIPIPEDRMRLSPAETRGRAVFRKACAACHGEATTGQIVNRGVHDQAFAVLKPDGNVLFEVPATNPPVAVMLPRPNNESINIGFAFFSYLGQQGLFPTFNDSVDLPHYRYRFYTDGTRTTKQVDLPPLPVTVSGDFRDLRPVFDADGNPIYGTNLLPQAFSTDPGRALISGDPADFEAFNVPPLRGVAHTAPYFHDNSTATLAEAINLYSRFVLKIFRDLHLPAVHPPEFPGGLEESLSVQEKRDLLEFLNML
jgi:cytochrome c peroxidase